MIHIQKKLEHIACHFNGVNFNIKWGQLERVVDILFNELQNIPYPVKVAFNWNLRWQPRGRITQKYLARNNEIVSTFRLEVFMPENKNKIIWWGPTCDNPLTATTKGWEAYGANIEVVQHFNDLVSFKVAEKELEKNRAAVHCMEKYGMNMTEMVRYVGRYKKLPPELPKTDSSNEPAGVEA